jgi:hypothetical protein
VSGRRLSSGHARWRTRPPKDQPLTLFVLGGEAAESAGGGRPTGTQDGGHGLQAQGLHQVGDKETFEYRSKLRLKSCRPWM